MSYTITIRCRTIELNSYAYKYSDSAELTKILRRVQATGIDDFLQFKAFKVGCLKYAPKPNSEYNPMSINIREGKGTDVYMSDDWQPEIEEIDDWVDTSMLDYIFNNIVNFKLPPKEYKRIIVEKTIYTAAHQYSVDDELEQSIREAVPNLGDTSSGIKKHDLLKAPFRSDEAQKEDNVLLDTLLISHYLVNRHSTSIIERQPANYRCNTFFKIPLPNEDEIALEDIRFDYFDYWRNL